jgi:hypothetical protein
VSVYRLELGWLTPVSKSFFFFLRNPEWTQPGQSIDVTTTTVRCLQCIGFCVITTAHMLHFTSVCSCLRKFSAFTNCCYLPSWIDPVLRVLVWSNTSLGDSSCKPESRCRWTKQEPRIDPVRGTFIERITKEERKMSIGSPGFPWSYFRRHWF